MGSNQVQWDALHFSTAAGESVVWSGVQGLGLCELVAEHAACLLEHARGWRHEAVAQLVTVFEYYHQMLPFLHARTSAVFNHSGIYVTETKALFGAYDPCDYGVAADRRSAKDPPMEYEITSPPCAYRAVSVASFG